MSFAHAQVNTEKLRQWDDSLGLTGAAGLSLNWRAGNTEFLSYALTGRMDYRAENFLFFILAEYSLISKDGEAFSRKGFYHARLNVPVEEWATWEIFGQQEGNRSTRLAQRWLAGTGGRFGIADGSVLKMVLGTAYMYEYEELSSWTEGVDVPVARVHRWSNYFVIRLVISDYADLVNTVYFQPRFDRIHDYRLLEEAVLAVKLGAWLTLQNELQLRYDNEPPSGIKPSDIAFLTGIAVTF
jgi:hypothetical protein